MRYRYRSEPGRLVLTLTELDLADRLPLDQTAMLRIDLGRAFTVVPPPLDFDLQGRFAPAVVRFDPQGRIWHTVEWTDVGRQLELWTPTLEGTT